jgi:hypothetical protein
MSVCPYVCPYVRMSVCILYYKCNYDLCIALTRAPMLCFHSHSRSYVMLVQQVVEDSARVLQRKRVRARRCSRENACALGAVAEKTECARGAVAEKTRVRAALLQRKRSARAALLQRKRVRARRCSRVCCFCVAGGSLWGGCLGKRVACPLPLPSSTLSRGLALLAVAGALCGLCL